MMFSGQFSWFFDDNCSEDMAAAAKAHKPTGRDSGYGKEFGGQKRKRGGAGKDEKEESEGETESETESEAESETGSETESETGSESGTESP